MKTRKITGWMAPGVTEQRDLRYLADEIMNNCLYARKDACLQNDCGADETPAYVTIEITVDHRTPERKEQ